MLRCVAPPSVNISLVACLDHCKVVPLRPAGQRAAPHRQRDVLWHRRERACDEEKPHVKALAGKSAALVFIPRSSPSAGRWESEHVFPNLSSGVNDVTPRSSRGRTNMITHPSVSHNGTTGCLKNNMLGSLITGLSLGECCWYSDNHWLGAIT